MSDERLQKILAQWGIASRRLAEQMIVAGRVRVNGNIVRLGEKANPDRDLIETFQLHMEMGKNPLQAAFDGSAEVASSRSKCGSSSEPPPEGGARSRW
mgnify:CR=1 FL=1